MDEQLDLQLRLGSCCKDSERPAPGQRETGAGDNERRDSGQRENQQGQHQITILYNGRICVGNVTEIQARAIIAMAEQEMNDQVAKKKIKELQVLVEEEENKSDRAAEQLLINQQNSMKRSLQRFLQKRKSRSDAIAPYDAHRPRLLQIN